MDSKGIFFMSLAFFCWSCSGAYGKNKEKLAKAIPAAEAAKGKDIGSFILTAIAKRVAALLYL